MLYGLGYGFCYSKGLLIDYSLRIQLVEAAIAAILLLPAPWQRLRVKVSCRYEGFVASTLKSSMVEGIGGSRNLFDVPKMV